ncbi:TnsA endonuclease C-terminal domain-containing protein [Burkholderia ambifaria]|nr:TnsA endonuclease C-terminal domain-containing protein [Burkholderia ambifaria]
MTTRTLRMHKRTLARKLAEQEMAKKTGGYARWYHTRDMPGSGIKTRLVCEKGAAAELHLMSEAEHAALLEAWWRSDVVTIFDQYALDRKKTRRAAASLNLDHPTYGGTSEPAVLSTDLVLVTRRGNLYGREAWSVKSTAPDGTAPLTRSQEIERRTWEDEGASYKAVTAHGMHANRSKNLAWIFRAANETVGRDLGGEEVKARRGIQSAIRQRRPVSVIEACRYVERLLGLPAGSGIRAFRQLAGEKRIRFDLNVADPLQLRLDDVWCCSARKAR